MRLDEVVYASKHAPPTAVCKWGATTGLTYGRVAGVRYDKQASAFVLKIAPDDRDHFCSQGDSGALVFVLDTTNKQAPARPLAILYRQSKPPWDVPLALAHRQPFLRHGYCLPLQPILDACNLDIV